MMSRKSRKHTRGPSASELAAPGGEQLAVPKVPALIQRHLDELIVKSKSGLLSDQEQADLDEMLDYLDDLNLVVLQRHVD